MTSLSTHVLDTATGRPAAGVRVRLDSAALDTAALDTAALDTAALDTAALGTEPLDTAAEASWREIAAVSTDQHGRIGDFGELAPGRYRLTFDVAGYFGADAFFPEATVTFRLTEGHHHVPLVMSPFAYSTYRGS
jgi:5-hydroxyisourate hydrolase